MVRAFFLKYAFAKYVPAHTKKYVYILGDSYLTNMGRTGKIEFLKGA